jgi:magnesium-transporting ATPase (P-type)
MSRGAPPAPTGDRGPSESGPAWHAIDLAAVRAALGLGERGLSDEEARARLARFGPNALPRGVPPSVAILFARQFASPLIYVLLLAAGLSLWLGDVSDAGFIGAVLLINAGIGTFNEWRAERDTRALRELLRIRAGVERDGVVRELDAEDVVPGDLVWLESGVKVPADVRLVEAQGLAVDESLLTGESLPAAKDARRIEPPEAGVADRHNMVFAGTTVAQGRGRGLVVATGVRTEVGRIARDVLAASDPQTPLLVRLERFTRNLVGAILAASLLLVLLGVRAGQSPSDMFLTAVALAVAAIPEGLPAVLTVTLAVAARRMARRNVIVRRLAAVEGLGSCTLIASDKTGTLTCNELTATHVWLADGSEVTATGTGFAPVGDLRRLGEPIGDAAPENLVRLLRAAVLCNEGQLRRHDGGWIWRGDPTDVALLALAHKGGIRRESALSEEPEVAAVPFEPQQRFAASLHRASDGLRVYVKGAPERILEMCAEGAPAAGADRAEILARVEREAARGRRLLAVAERTYADGAVRGDPLDAMQGFRLLGLIGMVDPPRPGVRESLAACRSAGVRVCMVTGDHPATALAVAREIGLAEDESEVVRGDDLAAQPPGALRGLVDRARIFARLAPHQKLEIVEAAQAHGHFVAVTGDGVNDAPALRVANIGVAMGAAGTDVARESAELVLRDDHFASIVSGIEEGRVAYDNVRKAIYLLVSFGAAEIVTVVAAVAVGLPLPLLPTQLLWLNLVTNGIQGVAIAFEPNEGGVLGRRPRPPSEPIFDRLMVERTLLATVVIAGICFASYRHWLEAGWSVDEARNALLLLLVLFMNLHVGNCRSETRSALALSPLRSPLLLFGTLAAQLLHIGAMYAPPMQQLLHIHPVPLRTWATLLGLASTILVAIELHKYAWGRRTRG